ncbi:MAG TPA: GxxExxY protein [Chthoniobacterales bacterium]
MHDTDYAFEEETYAVIGAALEVLSQLGHGIHEKPYENALAIELGLREICCQQQKRFDVIYKMIKVGEYVPDLIAADKIIVDTKVVDRITNHERGQMINYLRITGLPLGLIFNFRYAKLQWERLALTR